MRISLSFLYAFFGSSLFVCITREVPYFLEDNNNINQQIKDRNLIKNENSIIPHFLEDIKVNNEGCPPKKLTPQNKVLLRYSSDNHFLLVDRLLTAHIKRFDVAKIIDRHRL